MASRGVVSSGTQDIVWCFLSLKDLELIEQHDELEKEIRKRLAIESE